jgi:hypothetical protein
MYRWRLTVLVAAEMSGKRCARWANRAADTFCASRKPFDCDDDTQLTGLYAKILLRAPARVRFRTFR